MRLIGLLALIVTACSDASPRVGDRCEVDSDCATNVCWDFADHDPLCGGKVCSATCSTDDDCISRARDAGAALPERARCGDDRQCDLVGTGLGSFVCA
jgi:hypothetical protein